MPSTSKIDQLPRAARDELARRYDNGERAAELLPWLNGVPEVIEVLKRKFNGVEVSTQNFSNWLETGYCIWQEQQKELAFIHNATAFSKDVISSTGLQLTEGAAAIAAGTILSRLEDLRRKQLAGEEVDDEKMSNLFEMLNSVRTGEIKRELVQAAKDRNELHRDKGKRDQEKLQLDRDKFEIATAKAVLKHATSREVQDIVKGPGTNHEKIAALRKAMFPQRPLAAA